MSFPRASSSREAECRPGAVQLRALIREWRAFAKTVNGLLGLEE